ncbi:XRE family transcriptional regulator, partial [Methylococcaceae bacterium CS3]
LMENVRLLTSMKDSSGEYVSKRILDTFKSIDYNCAFFTINAKNYGIPQHRERVIFVGLRGDLKASPSIPLGNYGLKRNLFSDENPFLSFGDAVSDLEFIESGENSTSDEYHKAVNHPEHVIKWLVDVPEGKSAHENSDEELRPPSGYNTTYKRQVWNEPAGTVGTTYGMISGCRNVHPVATRALTTREALRLQSFPDSFKVTGKMGDIRTTIGNAVPPLLAYFLGEHIKKTYIL